MTIYIYEPELLPQIEYNICDLKENVAPRQFCLRLPRRVYIHGNFTVILIWPNKYNSYFKGYRI